MTYMIYTSRQLKRGRLVRAPKDFKPLPGQKRVGVKFIGFPYPGDFRIVLLSKLRPATELEIAGNKDTQGFML